MTKWSIMTLTESVGVENFHLFFLLPTGRGVKLTDISPQNADMIANFLLKSTDIANGRPSCAPQFMRITQNMGLDMRQWSGLHHWSSLLSHLPNGA